MRARPRRAGHIRVLLRRWYVVLAVLLCLVPLQLYARQAPGVYYTKFDILFLPPATAAGGNALRADAGATVHFAAAVERRFNAAGRPPAIKTSGAPLYGTGMRNGSSVYLPNAGGQWQTNFNRAAITVEIVNESAAAIETEAADIQAGISGLSEQLQEQLGVAPRAYITTYLSPERPEVAYIPAHNSRAAVVLLVLGGWGAWAGALAVDRLATARQRARPAAE